MSERTQTRILVRYQRAPRRWLALAGVLLLRYVALAPHLVANLVLHVWVAITSPIAMGVTAVRGEHPKWARRHVTTLVRRTSATRAWAGGLVDRYPPFAAPPDYPVRADPPRAPASNRWLAALGIVFLRAVAAIPAAIAAVAVGLAASAAAWVGHWIVLTTGDSSIRILDFVAAAIQLAARTMAWAWGLQDEYPPIKLADS